MIHPLEFLDYDKGFMELVNIFTHNNEFKSKENFKTIYKIIKKQKSFVYVIELDTKIVATIKIINYYRALIGFYTS